MVKTQWTQKQKVPIFRNSKCKSIAERKKLIKLCCKKIRIMDDPDSILCKAVLINNTLKYCQDNIIKDAAEEVIERYTDLDTIFEDSEEEIEAPIEAPIGKVDLLSMPIIAFQDSVQ